ncbi:hypothetical protein FA95DRAFT_1611271 [Auriscalpium vulgare]|uniref:Uncharacterized protein n=1 Tax=Auriscalpium vulgare TaxID=40419 RepID=A0ACB8RAJ8_9AGAM|nr:hypothetical protein FA95DRAFT_1611271 [Auriscalpium vulgare]
MLDSQRLLDVFVSDELDLLARHRDLFKKHVQHLIASLSVRSSAIPDTPSFGAKPALAKSVLQAQSILQVNIDALREGRDEVQRLAEAEDAVRRGEAALLRLIDDRPSTITSDSDSDAGALLTAHADLQSTQASLAAMKHSLHSMRRAVLDAALKRQCSTLIACGRAWAEIGEAGLAALGAMATDNVNAKSKCVGSGPDQLEVCLPARGIEDASTLVAHLRDRSVDLTIRRGQDTPPFSVDYRDIDDAAKMASVQQWLSETSMDARDIESSSPRQPEDNRSEVEAAIMDEAAAGEAAAGDLQPSFLLSPSATSSENVQPVSGAAESDAASPVASETVKQGGDIARETPGDDGDGPPLQHTDTPSTMLTKTTTSKTQNSQHSFTTRMNMKYVPSNGEDTFPRSSQSGNAYEDTPASQHTGARLALFGSRLLRSARKSLEGRRAQ